MTCRLINNPDQIVNDVFSTRQMSLFVMFGTSMILSIQQRDVKILIFQPRTENQAFGCSIDTAQQQMALNFELVVIDQLFSVVLATLK